MPHLLAAVACALLVLGCATTDDAEVIAPDVLLTDVKPVGAGLFEQRIRLTFRVTNPNDFDLDVRGLSFALDMNGEELARGVSVEPVRLPALGETLVEAEASTTTLGLLHQLLRLSERRELSYELRGRMHLDGAGVSSVPFSREADLGAWPGTTDPAR